MARRRGRRARVGLHHDCGVRFYIVDDPGGEVREYVQKFHELREAGEHFVIDGRCLSACTLFTGIIPHDHVCVTRRAVLGFHAPSFFDDARQTLVPNRQGTQALLRLYPPEIRDWIDRHGGLKPEFIALRGEELSALYNPVRKSRWAINTACGPQSQPNPLPRNQLEKVAGRNGCRNGRCNPI